MQNKFFSPLLKHCFLYLIFILLYGCQSIHNETDDITSYPLRAYRTEMEMSGRISIQYTFFDESENKSLHGKFNWKTDNSKTHIDLMSPLGQTLATIDISPYEAIYTASGKKPIRANNVETLLFYQLGWYLPISHMQNWIQGYVIDQHDIPTPVDTNEPKITFSNGWQIQYVSWNLSSENQRIPRRIDMVYTPPTTAKKHINQIQIRLIIDKW